jgi:hypothetical protein
MDWITGEMITNRAKHKYSQETPFYCHFIDHKVQVSGAELDSGVKSTTECPR